MTAAGPEHPLALVVDDSATSRDIFRTILEHGGFRVRAVETADAALAFLEQKGADVVVLDLFLPDVDGFAVLDRIRSTERTRDVPVVCVTAGATEEVRDRARALGCDAFAFKPESPRRVLELVRSVVDRRRAEAAG